MKEINKYEIKKLSFPIDGTYHYDVQKWTSVDGGRDFFHCGYGKFCRTIEEAQAYKADMEALENPAVPGEKKNPVLNGIYYFFECMSAFTNGIYKAAEFAGDSEAVRTAADHEASLYKLVYSNGQRISSRALYVPMMQ